MVKSELIQKLVNQQSTLSLNDVEQAVNLMLDKMSHALSHGERIEIRGFGSFAPRFRPPRKAHNPRTGQRVFTVAKHTPHFKPGKELRERVDQSRLTIPLKEDTSPSDEDES